MEITFTKVKLPYGWLGNMSAFPVRYDSETFLTAEHLFQCLRLPKDHDGWSVIKNQKSPMAAKMVAKTFSEFFIIEPRSLKDVENMLVVLQFKLKNNPQLNTLLKDTGDATIIEDCSNRPNSSGLFWGAAKTKNGWTGENILGKLWMKIRDEGVS